MGAFSLPNGSKDAVLLVTLPPGGYTALPTRLPTTRMTVIFMVAETNCLKAMVSMHNFAGLKGEPHRLVLLEMVEGPKVVPVVEDQGAGPPPAPNAPVISPR